MNLWKRLLLGTATAILFLGCQSSSTSTPYPQGKSTSYWNNGRGTPQNTGLAVWAGKSKAKLLAFNSVNASPEWVYTASGSPNGSFAVIDQEGTVYYQGSDNCLYAVKADGILKWKATNKNAGFVPPVIGPDGRIYAGDFQNWFYCLDPLDGKEIWSQDFGNNTTGFLNAPIVTSDGILYASSGDGNLYSMNLDGKLNWSFQQSYSVYGTPSVGHDGTVFIMTDRLYALEPTDGSVRWSFKPDTVPNSMGWWFESTPVVAADGAIYFIGYYNSVQIPTGRRIYLFALSSQGKELWRYQLTDGTSVMPSGVRTYPTLMPDGTILVSVSPRNAIVAIRPDGTLKTEKIFSEMLSDDASPSVDGLGRVYLSYRYGFACLSSDLSTILWEKIITDGSDGQFVESSPSLGLTSAYFTSRNGNTGGSLYSFTLNQ